MQFQSIDELAAGIEHKLAELTVEVGRVVKVQKVSVRQAPDDPWLAEFLVTFDCGGWTDTYRPTLPLAAAMPVDGVPN